MKGARDMPRRTWRGGRTVTDHRPLPDEVPVALVYDGTTQAVMMATPADLEDFAIGFSLTEGFAAQRNEIEQLEILPVETARGQGIEARIWLSEGAGERHAARRRAMLGPVGCGLCGIDSLAEALRPLPRRAAPPPVLTGADILAACAALRGAQPLHDLTRAVHAAAFWRPGAAILLREDVGRHNALDKLAGALSLRSEDTAAGAILLTSRVSVDMVQKTAMIGAGLIIAASAPTALAVAAARAAGIAIVAGVRDATFDIYGDYDPASGGSFDAA